MIKAIEECPTNLQFESQEPSETVHFLLRKHPITNLGWILGTILMIILPLILMTLFSSININTFEFIRPKTQLILLMLWYLLTMFFAFEAFLKWYFNVYIITDKRLIDIDFRGLWRKRISETSLGQIEDATYETNRFFHILFDYGNILVQTAAENTEFEFESVPKPGLVHDKFTDLVEQYKNEHR